MKLSLKLLFLVSAIVATSQTSYVAADGGDAVSASDAVPVESDAAVAVEESASVDDAGKECAAGDCEGGAEQVEEEEEPETADEPVVEEAKVPEDPKCPSRPHIIRCSAMYLDTNKNNALDREELETAMGQVPWLLRSLVRMLGSVDTIMKKCDADGDGKISIDHDMAATEETCLASCFKRNAFKRLFFPECEA